MFENRRVFTSILLVGWVGSYKISRITLVRELFVETPACIALLLFKRLNFFHRNLKRFIRWWIESCEISRHELRIYTKFNLAYLLTFVINLYGFFLRCLLPCHCMSQYWHMKHFYRTYLDNFRKFEKWIVVYLIFVLVD